MNDDNEMSNKQNNSYLIIVKDMLASIVGSAACVYTGQPFDTIKVRMQVQPGFFLSPFEAIKRTIKEESIVALWRGSVPAFIGALGENAMAFAVNGYLKRFLVENKFLFPSSSHSNEHISFYESFLTGAITGAFIPIVLCPCDVLKCRAQMNRASGMDSSLRHVFRSMIQRHGMRSLYIGFNIQLVRDVFFYSSFFGTYDLICTVLKNNTSLSDPIIYFTAGGFAGQVAWVLSIAPDTIKSRIQASNELEIPKTLETYRSILASQGYKGLFRGVEVAVIRAFPANAALFVGYEITRESLDRFW